MFNKTRKQYRQKLLLPRHATFVSSGGSKIFLGTKIKARNKAHNSPHCAKGLCFIYNNVEIGVFILFCA